MGSLGASGWRAVMGTSGGAMVAFGAISGGIGAELSGGNFWEGAVIGGTVAWLNHAMHKLINDSNIVDKETRRKFRSLVRSKDYQGAFDFINEKYDLDSEIKGKYTINFSDDDSFSGLASGEAFGIQEVTISKHVFYRSVAEFARVVHHEFVHVHQRAVLGMSGHLSISQVREFLAYHDTLFNNKLPKASFSTMKGYWHKAKQFFNYVDNNPKLIEAYKSQYNDYIKSKFFK